MRFQWFSTSKLAMAHYACILASSIMLGLFYVIVILFNPDGGERFFDNLALALPILFVWIFGSAGFFIGVAALIKDLEKSIIVLILTLICGFILWWGLMEVLVEH